MPASESERVLPARVVRMAGERAVHRQLDARCTVLRGHVAHGMSGERPLWVRPRVCAIILLGALGERNAVRGDDRSALDVGALGDGVIVRGHVLDGRCVDFHVVGEIADKDGKEQREHGDERPCV